MNEYQTYLENECTFLANKKLCLVSKSVTMKRNQTGCIKKYSLS